MKKFFSAFITTILMLPLFSCGKKGELLPPLIRLLQTTKEVRITQKADRIILAWKNPTAYEDGSPLSEIEKIEIWMLKEDKTAKKETVKKEEEQEEEKKESEQAAPELKPELKKEEFDQKARLKLTIEKDKISDYLASEDSPTGDMRYEYKLPLKDLGSKKYTFGLRVKDRKRFSAFSDLVSLEPQVLSLPPEEVTVSPFQDRIEVKWKSPSRNIDQSSPANLKGFNIYRIEGEEEPRRLNASLVKGEIYNDKQFAFDRSYKYFIRASATDSYPYLESEDSKEVKIQVKDTFAPAAPKALISVAGQNIISLSWDPNPEDDLDGYRVWKQEEGEKEFIPISREIIKENTYIDRAVRSGRKYSYCVTAVDRAGNESQKSEIVSDRIRERQP
jgi:predicted small lipoprotein YifL